MSTARTISNLTSLNVMGKPIAHSVEDALSIFFTSGLDAVFIDDLLIEK